MTKTLVLLAVGLALAGSLAGCADDPDESNDNVAAEDCDDRNLVDDDVIGDDDGTTLGECEERTGER